MRAIGNFIVSSGMEDAWVEAEWFDSYCVVQQVIDCKHMKRAVEVMEASMIATKIIKWKEMRTFEGIFNTITNLRDAMDFDHNDFGPLFQKLNEILRDKKFMQKWASFEATKINSFQFRFLSIFCNMIQRLIEVEIEFHRDNTDKKLVTSLISSGMSHAGFHINGQMQLQERLDGIYRRHGAFGNIRPRNMGLFYG